MFIFGLLLISLGGTNSLNQLNTLILTLATKLNSFSRLLSSVSLSLLKLISIKSVMSFNHLLSWLAWCPCCSRTARVFSKTLQQSSPKLSKSLLQNHSLKVSILLNSVFLWFSSHIHTWLLEKPKFDNMDLYWKVMFLPFSMLFRFFMAFLLSSKCFFNLMEAVGTNPQRFLNPRK